MLVLAVGVVGCAIAILFGAAGAAVAAPGGADDDEPDEGADADDLVPGGGTELRLARPTWDTGWFQAEVLAELLRRLGYLVAGPTTEDVEAFYDGLVDGSHDLWASGWFPLHDAVVDGRDEIVPIGTEVEGGALQGYVVDIATADELGIDDLGDLADPDVASRFDHDGDGVADMVGCNVEWSCGPIVDHHLEDLGLSDTVDQVQGDYGPLMQQLVDRLDQGGSVLAYTFTPNWTTGELVPGEDVRWLPLPRRSYPDDAGGPDAAVPVPGLDGCSDDPCQTGFPPNDIRSVAARRVLDDQPAVAELLERFAIPLEDIEAQNARMVSARADADDIALHARQWLADNEERVTGWLEAATRAHVDAGLELAPRPDPATAAGFAPVGPVRVVTRLSAPFVTYEDPEYSGFSIELWDRVAARIGADAEVYAVNSAAKLVDEVRRGAADIGVAPVGMTPDREEVADFSHPFIETGLQVMVLDDNDDGLFSGTVGALVRRIFSWQLLSLVLVLVLALLVAAHVIWWTERGRNPDFPEDYGEGIWEAFWWAAVTATTVGYGDRTPIGRGGRIVALVWMFAGLFLLAYFTAGIATTFTLDEIEGSIGGFEDLPGTTVAVPTGSEAENFLERNGITTRDYATPGAAYQALRDGDVEAVVHDAAILQYRVRTDDSGQLRLAGTPFHRQQYGFVVPDDPRLRERINVALLELYADGEYARLYEQWFGQAPSA